MKKLNNNGFTLIELLAVIIVLAIVALVGYSTIFPILDSSKKQAFATEANFLLDAAQNAMTLNQLGKNLGTEVTENGKKYTCFTLSDLAAENLFEKNLKKDEQGNDIVEYKGKVLVAIDPSNHLATYTVYMKNNDYSVSNVTGAVDVNKVGNASDLDDARCTCQ
jgi:prepilin-type N-terminal cleavage/methylation domain-containing protein